MSDGIMWQNQSSLNILSIRRLNPDDLHVPRPPRAGSVECTFLLFPVGAGGESLCTDFLVLTQGH